MSFTATDLRFLLSAEYLGFSGKKVCTLGRLSLFGTQAAFAKILKEYAKPQFLLPSGRDEWFAEDILCPLGFEVDSIDASKYEGATVVHDLNQPLSESMGGQYDLVFDGGTLEHIFNFPIAMQSVMRMLKVGGHVLMNVPTNNYCGHGFYQFSPELFFRLFSPDNGFEVVRVYMQAPGGPYHVIDPAIIRRRVTLVNSEATLLLVHAKKITETPISNPQQSDYTLAWNRHKKKREIPKGLIETHARRALLKLHITQALKKLRKYRSMLGARGHLRVSQFSNRRFYAPVTDWRVPSKTAFSN